MSCIVDELAEALKSASSGYHNVHHDGPWNGCGLPACYNDYALIERAKEHDCIPVEDVKEAAQEGHRYG